MIGSSKHAGECSPYCEGNGSAWGECESFGVAMPFSKNKEKTVYMLRRDTRCRRCGRELRSGEFIYPTGDIGICLRCAGLARLMFLPKGSVAVTRRAKRYSLQYAVVLKKSPVHERYQRQGILVEARAMRRARAESAADAETRVERRRTAANRREKEDQAFIAAFAEAIVQHYPRCPEVDAHGIAAHACRKYSGRVGRSAAAKRLEPAIIRLAVMAHIRHGYTEYDQLLTKYCDRDLARTEVRKKVKEILDKWVEPGQPHKPR
jgi:hypothetical protein